MLRFCHVTSLLSFKPFPGHISISLLFFPQPSVLKNGSLGPSSVPHSSVCSLCLPSPPRLCSWLCWQEIFSLPSISPGGICAFNLFGFSWISQGFPGVFAVAHIPEMLVLVDFSALLLICKEQRAEGTGGFFCTQNYHLSPALLNILCALQKPKWLKPCAWSLCSASYPSHFTFPYHCLCITRQSPCLPVLHSPLRCAIFCYIWQPRRSLEPLLNREIPILLNTNNCAFSTHCCHQMFELSCLEQPGPLAAWNVKM